MTRDQHGRRRIPSKRQARATRQFPVTQPGSDASVPGGVYAAPAMTSESTSQCSLQSTVRCHCQIEALAHSGLSTCRNWPIAFAQDVSLLLLRLRRALTEIFPAAKPLRSSLFAFLHHRRLRHLSISPLEKLVSAVINILVFFFSMGKCPLAGVHYLLILHMMSMIKPLCPVENKVAP